MPVTGLEVLSAMHVTSFDMHTQRHLRDLALSLTICIAAFLSSCKTAPPPAPPAPVAPATKPTGLYEWTALGKDITSIKINVDEQKAYLFSGEEQIGWTYVASGITSFPTPTGEFKVLEKIADKVSNLYGKGYDANGMLVNSDFKQGRDLLPPGGRFEPAKMTYFMRLTGDGVGMHIGPIPSPGRRASHGCIRLPSKFAGTIFKHTAVGTPVTITGKGPDYATYMKQSADKAKANAAKLAAAKKKAAEATAALEAVSALAPSDPNGPVPATTPGAAVPAGTTSPTPGPLTPVSPPEEIRPAAPTPSN